MKKKISVTIISIIGIQVILLSLIIFTINNYIDNNCISFDWQFRISEDIFLERTSKYMVSLKGDYFIPEYIDRIGWNNDYVIAQQYDLVNENDYNDYKVPDKTKTNYYIIDIKAKTIEGPLDEKEYRKRKVDSIKLKKII